jgi:predicted transcriptional regulator
MVEFTVHIADDVMQRLKERAEHQERSFDDLVQAAIENFLDDNEPSKEEILEDLRIGMMEALAGKGRPAHELLEELRREFGANANKS